MGRLFGTDGARGVANSQLTCELALEIGRAAAAVLIDGEHKRPKVLIGKDTRMSSDMLEASIAAGLCSVGADVTLLGVIPTPAVAFLVKEYKYDAAVMISASHNPCEYNGIKIFTSEGYKLPDAVEDEIEAIIFDKNIEPPIKTGGDVGRIVRAKTQVEDYVNHVKSTTDERFSGIKLAIDCANGASSVTARKLFTELGADCMIINDSPDGVNINANCGSTHLSALQKFVVDNKCDLGVAFDGDADRMLAVDENGNEVNGDKVIAICSHDMKQRGKLKGNAAVVTVMSNMGFFKYCEKYDIKCERTKVGDRYVLENMLQNDFSIGGEQSGHVIFHEFATTGDGELTATQLLSIVKRTGKKLSELASIMETYPQVLINVMVSNEGKEKYGADAKIKEAIEKADKALGDNGRVLVRISGTEPLIRVMVEGRDRDLIEKIGNDIADLVRERLS